MNYRLLHVSAASMSSVANRAVIEKRLSDLGRDWMCYNAMSWVLWSNKSIPTISEMIHGDLLPTDQLLVIAINPDEPPNGRLPDWAWEWLNRPRNPTTGDVLTPALAAPNALNLFNQNRNAWFPPPQL